MLLLIPGVPSSSLLVDVSLGVGAAVALAVVGLVDDIRHLHPLLRLGAQLLAAYGAWAIGFRVEFSTLEALNLLLTLLWIVGVANAFNLLDNMDGLSAGLAGVSAASFAIMGVLENVPTVAIVSASLSGAAFGFLAHNRHPAKAFMGDAGSLFLGYLLALIGIRLRFQNLPEVTFLVPVVVLGLPIFDTTLVVLTRLKHGRSIFQGGRDHISHRLVRLGLPVRTAVGFLYFGGFSLGWLGLVVSRSNPQVGWMLLGFVLVLGIFFGRLLWKIAPYKPSSSTIPVVQEPILDEKEEGEAGGGVQAI